MKKIGLVGGLGPASTIEYYVEINRLYKERFGEAVYPKMVIDSVNLSLHTEHFNKGNFEKIGELLIESLTVLKNAGADIAGITANTEHIAWDFIKDRLPLRTVSIVDAVIEEIKRKGYKRVVVFATEWTLKSGLFDKALKKAGIFPILPDKDDAQTLGNLIYPNLENGIVIPEDKEKMIALATSYIEKYNADSLLLGCTEIPLMLKDGDLPVPLINTTKIHANELFKASLL